MRSRCCTRAAWLRCLLSGSVLLLAIRGIGQPTVGLTHATPEAWPGYTLFAPMSSLHTYLIDNEGRLRHRWTSRYRPGASAYLLPNRYLLRTAISWSPYLRDVSGWRSGERPAVERVDRKELFQNVAWCGALLGCGQDQTGDDTVVERPGRGAVAEGDLAPDDAGPQGLFDGPQHVTCPLPPVCVNNPSAALWVRPRSR